MKMMRARNKEIADAQRLRRLARKHGLWVVRPRGRLHPAYGAFGVVDESDAWVLCREVAEDEDDWGDDLTLAGVERGLKRLLKG